MFKPRYKKMYFIENLFKNSNPDWEVFNAPLPPQSEDYLVD